MPKIRQRPPRPPRKRFTETQKKFIEAKLNGANDTEAALAAGASPKHPGQSGHQLKKAIEEKLPQVYIALGLTRDEFIQRHIARCLEAKETKYFAHEGRVQDEREVIAWDVQQRAQHMVFQLAGDYAEARENSGPSIKVVVINAQNRPQNGHQVLDVKSQEAT